MVLKKYYDLACNDLFCYSSNSAMTEPKTGFEQKWREALEECEILNSMLHAEKADKPRNLKNMLISDFSKLRPEDQLKELHQHGFELVKNDGTHLIFRKIKKAAN